MKEAPRKPSVVEKKQMEKIRDSFPLLNEADVISALIHNEDSAKEVVKVVEESQFDQKQFRWLYQKIKHHYEKYDKHPDQKYFLNEIPKGMFDEFTEKTLIKWIVAEYERADKPISYASDEITAYIIQNKIADRLQSATDRLRGNILSPNERNEIINNLNSLDECIPTKQDRSSFELNLIGDFDRIAEEARKEEQENRLLLFPLPSVNRITGGVCPGEFCTLVGNTGDGKTTIAICIAIDNWLNRGMHTVFIAAEQHYRKVAYKFYSALTGVRATEFGHWNFDDDEEKALKKQIHSLSEGTNAELFILQTQPKANKISWISDQLKHYEDRLGTGIQAVYIDRAGLFMPNKFHQMEERHRQEAVHEEVKDLVLKHAVPGITIAQANKQSLGKETKLGHTGESYAIDQLADASISFNALEKKPKWYRSLLINKGRNGPKDISIPVKVFFGTMKIQEIRGNHIIDTEEK